MSYCVTPSKRQNIDTNREQSQGTLNSSAEETEEIYEIIDSCELIKSLNVAHFICIEIAQFAIGHFNGCLSLDYSRKRQLERQKYGINFHFKFRRPVIRQREVFNSDRCKKCFCDCFQLRECVSCNHYFCPKCCIFPAEWRSFIVCKDCFDESIVECTECGTKCKLYYAANHTLYTLDDETGTYREMSLCGHADCDIFVCLHCNQNEKHGKAVHCQMSECEKECGFRCKKHECDILFCFQHQLDCELINWTVDEFLCAFKPWFIENNQITKRQIKRKLIEQYTSGNVSKKVIKSIPNFHKAIEFVKANPAFILN